MSIFCQCYAAGTLREARTQATVENEKWRIKMRVFCQHDTADTKDLKGLKKQSLRDNMSTTELTLNQLVEVATRELSQQEQPVGFEENKQIAQAGGSVAGNARKDLEQRLGRSIITSQNAAQLNHVVTQMIEASAEAAEESEKEE